VEPRLHSLYLNLQFFYSLNQYADKIAVGNRKCSILTAILLNNLRHDFTHFLGDYANPSFAIVFAGIGDAAHLANKIKRIFDRFNVLF
jgi:hypothetical protein